MKKSISALSIVLAFVFISSAMIPGAASAEKHEKLYGELKDIEGWKGGDPQGLAMEMAGMKMVQASRTYKKGDDVVSAMIMIGGAAASGAITAAEEMKFESSEGKSEVKQIDGFTVHSVYNNEEKAGAITVFLDPKMKETSVFVLSYTAISEEEAMKLAKKFDWKSIRNTAGSLD